MQRIEERTVPSMVVVVRIFHRNCIIVQLASKATIVDFRPLSDPRSIPRNGRKKKERGKCLAKQPTKSELNIIFGECGAVAWMFPAKKSVSTNLCGKLILVMESENLSRNCVAIDQTVRNSNNHFLRNLKGRTKAKFQNLWKCPKFAITLIHHHDPSLMHKNREAVLMVRYDLVHVDCRQQIVPCQLPQYLSRV